MMASSKVLGQLLAGSSIGEWLGSGVGSIRKSAAQLASDV